GPPQAIFPSLLLGQERQQPGGLPLHRSVLVPREPGRLSVVPGQLLRASVTGEPTTPGSCPPAPGPGPPLPVALAPGDSLTARRWMLAPGLAPRTRSAPARAPSEGWPVPPMLPVRSG